MRAIKKSQKELQKKFDAKINTLKELCPDKQNVGRLIDDIVSLKGQMDVQPVRLHIPEEDVIKEYKFGYINDGFRIVKCKNCYIFTCAGFYVISYPIYSVQGMKEGTNGGVLYATFDALCDMKDHYEEMTDDEKQNADAIFNVALTIFSLPLFIFKDDTMTIELATEILKKHNEISTKTLNEKLHETTKEDIIENDADRMIENINETNSQVKKDLLN